MAVMKLMHGCGHGNHSMKKKDKRKKEERTSRMGIWNIRNINTKESELVAEFGAVDIDFLGITEIKRKEREN